MPQQELSSIAVHIVGQYHLAGKALVNAYRSSAQRVLSGTAARYPGAQPVTDFLATRLQADTEQIVLAMDRLAGANTKGLEGLAARAAGYAAPGADTVRELLTTLQLPAATVSARIADTVLESAQALETRASGSVGVEAATPALKSAARPARRAVRKAA